MRVLVTLDSMKAGALRLGVDIPRGATFKKIEKLIGAELSKHPTYSAYACGGCMRDIIHGLARCPYCDCPFFPSAGQEVQAYEEPKIDTEPEDADYEEQEETPIAVEEENEWDEEIVEDDWGEETTPAPKPTPKPKRVKKAKTPKTRAKKRPPKSKESRKISRLEREKENERKRAVIRKELPYNRGELEAMKRPILLMTASLVGIDQPQKIAGIDLIPMVMTAQKDWAG